MQLWGPQRFVLQGVQDLQGQSNDFISETEIAAHTKMEVGDVRNCLITLEGDGFISLARTSVGFAAFLESKGRLALTQHSPLATPELQSEKRPSSVKLRPKGLHSFDSQDADFFLDLLPGPRGKGGIPQSIDYWKTRIEERDADRTFRVGVIYGPSGCGKSSLVKAGLLPCLAEDIEVVYLEATPQETEVRLLTNLRKQHSDLSNDLGLTETLTILAQKTAQLS